MDGLEEILYTLRQNKLRTALTAFGVFWGIFMLILLLGTGRGMEKALSADRFNDIADSLFIFPATTTVPFKGLAVGRNIVFTEADVLSIRKEIPGILAISSEINMTTETSVTFGSKYGNFSVLGVADEFFTIKEKIQFNNGRRLNVLDKEESRKVVVIGTSVSERLFGTQGEPIGKSININGISFKVIGLFYDKGNRGRFSERAYIPMSTFKKAFGGGQDVSIISLRAKPAVDGIALEEKVLEFLRQRHNIAPDDTNAMFVSNKARSAKEVKETFVGLNLFIWLVGIGTLLAGIVGVSNIMIITVKERTREIGIRKALGANPQSIINSLIIESVLVTSIAGYCGLVCGVALLELAAAMLIKFKIDLPYFQSPEIDLGIALSALGLLIIAGVIAGLIPALKAARIMPIEAMRAE